MGASGWSYSTPYPPDVGAALRRLRREVLERGDYDKPWEEIWRHHDSILAKPPGRWEAHERQYIRTMRSFPMPDRDFVPSSIEELLEHNAESGTHSILDIDGIADEPTSGAATPVPDGGLIRAFGTAQPTAEQVEASGIDFGEGLDRWRAVYFVVYRDGRPSEIRFEGCSGD
jgi:hypothetical protein